MIIRIKNWKIRKVNSKNKGKKIDNINLSQKELYLDKTRKKMMLTLACGYSKNLRILNKNQFH